MPQISKIRITNFSYNDGKRLIADELFDFANKEEQLALNSLINLKNGGGKSVLVQLMLQPIHPKAKVAGRKIESFFTKASDHCFVVIEWFKDNSTEKLMTGIAMASGESAGNSEETKGKPIKYYTFISNYLDYSNNFNIVNLPLSDKNRNSFLAASFNTVRDLAKKSNDVLACYSSDESRRWREKIAEYGIIQEEWKNIIEELNSVEGGMTEFFTGFKESDQLINQLLIPTIEGKFGQFTAKEEDATLSTMLIEHAKAYNKQKDLIEEKEACQSFQILLRQINEMVHNVWNKNDDYEKKVKELTAFFNALCGKKEALEEKLESLEETIVDAQNELEHIEYEKCSEDYYTSREKFENARENYRRLEAELEAVKNSLDDINHKIEVFSCAKLYVEVCELDSKLKAIQAEIKAKSENDDSTKKLNNLSFSVMQAINSLYPKAKEELEKLSAELFDLRKNMSADREKFVELQKLEIQKKTAYDRADEAFENACDETDKLIKALDIDAMRYLDGCYRMGDIQKNKVAKDKENSQLNSNIEKLHSNGEKLLVRNTQIEAESLDFERKKLELESSRKSLNAEFEKYAELEACLGDICGIYNFEMSDMFNDRLLDYFRTQENMSVAKKESIAMKISMIDDEIQAAEKGYIHVPKRVIEYLDYAGIRYQTCEQYLNSITGDKITKEQCLKILKNYPAIAYGIILDEKEKTKLINLEREMEDWLPSMVPVFTHEQFEKALSIKENKGGAIAFYSVEYFSMKDSFVEGIKSKKQELEDQKDTLTRTLETYAIHKKKAELMSDYKESSRQNFKMELKYMDDELSKIAEKLVALVLEKNKNDNEITKIGEGIENGKKQIRIIENWLEKYEDLLLRLETEKIKLDDKARDYEVHENAKRELDDCNRMVQKAEDNLKVLEAFIKEKEAFFAKLEETKTELGEPTQGTLVEGEWKNLLNEYRELKKSQNEELAVLNEREMNCLDRIGEKKDSIKEYNLEEEEYARVTFDEATFASFKQTRKVIFEKSESLQNKSAEAREDRGRCETAYGTAEKAISEYNGMPLEMYNIKGNYAERKREAKKTLGELNLNRKKESDKKNNVIRFIDCTKNVLAGHKMENPSIEVRLEENIEEQFGKISDGLKNAYCIYKNEKNALALSLSKEVLKDTTHQFNELQALKSFEKLVALDEFKGDKYYTLSERIDGVINATKLRFSQIETDLEEFNKSKSDLLRQCVFQGRRVYDGLRSMAKSSAVSIVEGKPKKQMIKIDVPDEIDINVAEAAIDGELDTGIQEIVTLLNNDNSEADIKKTANRVIGSQTLLRKYVGKDNIRVDVYKIDLNPDNAKYRTWRETQINSSGGEKLVSYFALILSLLNYSRSDHGDINDKNLTSVLILDNPFGAVSSGHLLEPMFEIANHFRVQLICLSDINKADITACFDNFIKASVKPLKYSTLEMLTHEGNEAIEHGFYRSEQISLF